MLTGEEPAEIARRWDTRGGATVEPPAERDTETLAPGIRAGAPRAALELCSIRG